MPKQNTSKPSLPVDAETRNQYPIAEGCLDYFPNAIAEVSRLSYLAGAQHHPGKPMHWDRDKSTDHRNKILKHLIDCGMVDTDGVLHDVKVAWRALAQAQETLERLYGYPLPKAAIPLEDRV